MRNGEKWYYKSCELIAKHLGPSTVQYKGFERVEMNNRVHTAGVFETLDPNLDLSKFESRFRNYSNKACGIMFITCHKQIGIYQNCILVHLY